MREKDLKLAVSEYLEYGTNQGKWYADRLNSGEAIVIAGQSRRRITLCREGTADFIVIRRNRSPYNDWGGTVACCFANIIFIELKGDKGKQSPEQGAFQKLVESQGAEYAIIRSIDELEAILEAL